MAIWHGSQRKAVQDRKFQSDSYECGGEKYVTSLEVLLVAVKPMTESWLAIAQSGSDGSLIFYSFWR